MTGTPCRVDASVSRRLEVKSALSTSAITRLAAPETTASSAAQRAVCAFRACTVRRRREETLGSAASGTSPVSSMIEVCRTQTQAPDSVSPMAASKKPVAAARSP